jgi:hypothetical protein
VTERRLRFFATPQEFDALVWPVAAEAGMMQVPWFQTDWPPVEEPAFAVTADATIAADGHHDRVHLSGHSEAGRGPGIGLRLAPAREGWITVELPLIKDGALIECEITAFSGRWTSSDTENPMTAEILRLFRIVTKPIRPRLRYPTWAENVVHGGSSAYRTIGHTDGAIAFERSGGMLKNRVSLNVRYSTQPIEGAKP